LFWGPTPKPPIPNPQSPIPTPKVKYKIYKIVLIKIKLLNKYNKKNES